jgi:hypothetical protein
LPRPVGDDRSTVKSLHGLRDRCRHFDVFDRRPAGIRQFEAVPPDKKQFRVALARLTPRWVVERTLAWLHRFRRLNVRYGVDHVVTSRRRWAATSPNPVSPPAAKRMSAFGTPAADRPDSFRAFSHAISGSSVVGDRDSRAQEREPTTEADMPGPSAAGVKNIACGHRSSLTALRIFPLLIHAQCEPAMPPSPTIHPEVAVRRTRSHDLSAAPRAARRGAAAAPANAIR